MSAKGHVYLKRGYGNRQPVHLQFRSHVTMQNEKDVGRADARLLGGPERPFSWEQDRGGNP